MAPVAPASESEALWINLRRLEGHVHGLEERLELVEGREDLGDLREQLRALAAEVEALQGRLLDLLQEDRASFVEVLAHRPRTPQPPRPVTSLGPPREVRAQLRAWAGAALLALGGALAAGIAGALARGCGGG